MVNCLCDHILSENICRNKMTQYAQNRPASYPLNVRLGAAKKIFAQSKCMILHVLHKLRKKRARNTSVVQADPEVTFHTITSSVSLVMSYQSCWACQHLIKIRLITSCIKKQPIKNADVCPCDSAGIEHNNVH